MLLPFSQLAISIDIRTVKHILAIRLKGRAGSAGTFKCDCCGMDETQTVVLSPSCSLMTYNPPKTRIIVRFERAISSNSDLSVCENWCSWREKKRHGKGGNFRSFRYTDLIFNSIHRPSFSSVTIEYQYPYWKQEWFCAKVFRDASRRHNCCSVAGQRTCNSACQSLNTWLLSLIYFLSVVSLFPFVFSIISLLL